MPVLTSLCSVRQTLKRCLAVTELVACVVKGDGVASETGVRAVTEILDDDIDKRAPVPFGSSAKLNNWNWTSATAPPTRPSMVTLSVMVSPANTS